MMIYGEEQVVPGIEWGGRISEGMVLGVLGLRKGGGGILDSWSKDKG